MIIYDREIAEHLSPQCYLCNNCEIFPKFAICHAYMYNHKDEKLIDINNKDMFDRVFEECPFRDWLVGKSEDEMREQFFLQRFLRAQEEVAK